MSGGPPRSSEPDGQQCECPEVDGVVYHDKAICTDPVVSLLGWFAGAPDDSAPAPDAPMRGPGGRWRPVSDLPEVKAAIEAAREEREKGSDGGT